MDARTPDPSTDVLQVAPGELLATVKNLKSAQRMDLLLDVTAVDWPGRTPRFDVVWHFYSTVTFRRVRVKTQVEEADPVVDSLTPLYGAAAFIERECHEMYGIRFRGNADLRPLLLYEGFAGHPLRKDYPLRGRGERDNFTVVNRGNEERLHP
jgi:NADH-quinone oxidoreductase subunit C